MEAQIPIIKTLDGFDFDAVPQLNRQKLFALAQGEYIDRKEPILLLDPQGLDKTHIATALATQQMRHARFFNAVGLVDGLIQHQQSGTIKNVINRLLKHG